MPAPPQTNSPTESKAAVIVLVVHDESNIQQFITKVLASHGYTVLGARHPVHALQVSRQHESPIHLLIAGIRMPYMDGGGLAAHIKVLYPQIRTLYICNTYDKVLLGRTDLGKNWPLLNQPFGARDLLDAVRSVLDASRG